MQKTTLQALSACREYSRDCRHDLWKGTQVLHEASDSCSSMNACSSSSSSYMLALQSCLPAQMFTQMQIANLKVAIKMTHLINVNQVVWHLQVVQDTVL